METCQREKANISKDMSILSTSVFLTATGVWGRSVRSWPGCEGLEGRFQTFKEHGSNSQLIPSKPIPVCGQRVATVCKTLYHTPKEIHF